MSRSSSSAKAISVAIKTTQRGGSCSTAPSDCATAGQKSPEAPDPVSSPHCPGYHHGSTNARMGPRDGQGNGEPTGLDVAAGACDRAWQHCAIAWLGGVCTLVGAWFARRNRRRDRTGAPGAVDADRAWSRSRRLFCGRAWALYAHFRAYPLAEIIE